MTIDLDVVIVSHGGEELLRRCLSSLAEHPCQGEMRVTVVDSGSPDATPDMVEREFPEVDRAEWFDPEEARRKIIAAQVTFVDRLLDLLGVTRD